MNVEQLKQERTRTDWIRDHALTSEQRKELIMRKVQRAQDQLKRFKRLETEQFVK